MTRIKQAAIGLALAILLLLPVRHAQGAEAPPPPQDALLYRDEKNQIELRIPAPYWEIQRAEQTGAQRPPGGCSAPARTPAGMLLHMRNKDAQAEAALWKMPRQFLVRNKGDLEDYSRALEESFKSRGGRAAEVRGKPFEAKEDEGIFVHRFEFIAATQAAAGPGGCAPKAQVPGAGKETRYLVADYFVRPAGEDVRHFMLICAAPAAVFERQAQDFVALTNGFRFTGQVAGRFFEPNAPEERLPSVQPLQGRTPMCGSAGLLIPVLAVLLVYWFFRRRSRPRGVLEP